MAESKRLAEKEKRRLDAKAWDDMLTASKKAQDEKRRLDAKYWEDVRKAWVQARLNNQKSQLNFGLL